MTRRGWVFDSLQDETFLYTWRFTSISAEFALVCGHTRVGKRTVSDFYKAAHVNQCPWCLMVRASIISTRRRIRRRLETGVCPADSRCGSVAFTSHNPPPDMVCKCCGVEATNLPQLFAHIRSHFP